MMLLLQIFEAPEEVSDHHNHSLQNTFRNQEGVHDVEGIAWELT